MLLLVRAVGSASLLLLFDFLFFVIVDEFDLDVHVPPQYVQICIHYSRVDSDGGNPS